MFALGHSRHFERASRTSGLALISEISCGRIHWFRAAGHPQFCLGLKPTIIAGRGTVRVPMLVRILRTYELPEILMLAVATLCVVISVAYLLGG
jgi:hypothetical protein